MSITNLNSYSESMLDINSLQNKNLMWQLHNWSRSLSFSLYRHSPLTISDFAPSVANVFKYLTWALVSLKSLKVSRKLYSKYTHPSFLCIRAVFLIFRRIVVRVVPQTFKTVHFYDELDIIAGDNNKGSNKEMAPKSNVARIRNWLGLCGIG